MQIQKESYRLSEKQIQVDEEETKTNSVLITVQKEFNPTEKWTIKTPYRHPNYKRPFDEWQGKNEHT